MGKLRTIYNDDGSVYGVDGYAAGDRVKIPGKRGVFLVVFSLCDALFVHADTRRGNARDGFRVASADVQLAAHP